MEAVAARQSWSDDRIDGLEFKLDVGFERVEERFEQVDRRFEQVDRRFEQVDRRFEQVDRRFDEVDRRLTQVERRVDRLGTAVENGFRDLRGEMAARFEQADGRFYSFQRTMVVLHGGIIAGLIGVIATQL